MKSAQIPEKTAFAARKKLAKIRAELDMELKMQQATEKIMHVSNESQKGAILGQLESSDKRIQHLNLEVETYMKAIESLPEGTEKEVILASVLIKQYGFIYLSF